MARRRAGFTLYEVLLSLVVTAFAATSFSVLTRATARTIHRGRRLTLMADRADAAFAGLRHEYRRLAPACNLPDSGIASTADGVRIGWAGWPDSTSIRLQLVISDVGVYPQRIDTMWTRFRCE